MKRMRDSPEAPSRKVPRLPSTDAQALLAAGDVPGLSALDGDTLADALMERFAACRFTRDEMTALLNVLEPVSANIPQERMKGVLLALVQCVNQMGVPRWGPILFRTLPSLLDPFKDTDPDFIRALFDASTNKELLLMFVTQYSSVVRPSSAAKLRSLYATPGQGFLTDALLQDRDKDTMDLLRYFAYNGVVSRDEVDGVVDAVVRDLGIVPAQLLHFASHEQTDRVRPRVDAELDSAVLEGRSVGISLVQFASQEQVTKSLVDAVRAGAPARTVSTLLIELPRDVQTKVDSVVRMLTGTTLTAATERASETPVMLPRVVAPMLDMALQSTPPTVAQQLEVLAALPDTPDQSTLRSTTDKVFVLFRELGLHLEPDTVVAAIEAAMRRGAHRVAEELVHRHMEPEVVQHPRFVALRRAFPQLPRSDAVGFSRVARAAAERDRNPEQALRMLAPRTTAAGRRILVRQHRNAVTATDLVYKWQDICSGRLRAPAAQLLEYAVALTMVVGALQGREQSEEDVRAALTDELGGSKRATCTRLAELMDEYRAAVARLPCDNEPLVEESFLDVPAGQLVAYREHGKLHCFGADEVLQMDTNPYTRGEWPESVKVQAAQYARHKDWVYDRNSAARDDYMREEAIYSAVWNALASHGYAVAVAAFRTLSRDAVGALHADLARLARHYTHGHAFDAPLDSNDPHTALVRQMQTFLHLPSDADYETKVLLLNEMLAEHTAPPDSLPVEVGE